MLAHPQVLIEGIITLVVGIALILPIFGHYALWQMPAGVAFSAIGCTEIVLAFIKQLVPAWGAALIGLGFFALIIFAGWLVFCWSQRRPDPHDRFDQQEKARMTKPK